MCWEANPGLAKEPADLVLAALAGRHGWLLVLDSATARVRPLLDQLLRAEGSGGHVVITTRSDRLLDPGAATEIEVRPFSESEAVEFLRSWPDPGGDVAEEEMAELARVVGGLPVALDQALRRRVRPAEYVRELRRAGAELLDRDTSPDYGRSVTASIRLALRDLADADLAGPSSRGGSGSARQWPIGSGLLGLVSAFGDAPVPLDLLVAASDDLPPPLAAAAGKPLLLDDAAAALLFEQGLARPFHDPVAGHAVVAVSPLVRLLVAADAGPAGEHAATAARVLCTVVSAGVADTPEAWPWWSRLLPHLHAVAESPVARSSVLPGDDVPVAVTLLDAAAAYLRLRGEVTAALADSRTALEIVERFLARHPAADSTELAVAVADRRVRLANALSAAGQASAALPVVEPAVAALRGALGRHPLVSEAQLATAAALRALGRPSAALAAVDDAIAVLETVYGDAAPELSRYLTNRALLGYELVATGAVRSPDQALDRARRDLDRADRLAAPGVILLVSGGGAVTPAYLQVSRAQIDLGERATSATVSVTNVGGRPSAVRVSGASGAVTISPPSDLVAPGRTAPLAIRLDRRDLTPGEYAEQLSIAPVDGGIGATVELSYTVSGPTAALSLNETSGTAPVFSWSAVPGATGYKIERECCADDGYANSVSDDETETSTTLDAEGEGTWRWRVWAVGADGQQGPPSDWGTYTVDG